VSLPDGSALARFRKTDNNKVGDRWVAGNLYILKELPDEVQTELMAALSVIALS
jgi:hypothetical protein